MIAQEKDTLSVINVDSLQIEQIDPIKTRLEKFILPKFFKEKVYNDSLTKQTLFQM
ncbi:MAG: hypothetical protein Ct9H300mP18_13290 [Candidatus Neomarinimicrobiota bacterium]|nr:MAG: hypothetical protein Ct9H300mP18_13290 [Candidatus Neomarinimicrobiota bacterium]